MSTFLPLFLQELGASVGMAATIIGIGTSGVLLFDLPSGFVTARFGERITLTVSGLVMTAAALLIGIAGNLWLAALGIFGAYASASFWFLGRLSFMRRVLRVDQRGRGLATAGGVIRIGQLVGPVAGGFLVEAAGYHWVFYGTAALALGSLLCFLVFEHTVRPAPLSAISGEGRLLDLGALRNVLRLKADVFATAGVSMILLSLVRAGRSLIFPLWGQSIGLEPAAIGMAVGLSSGVDTLVFYPSGLVSDRLGRKWAAVSCMVVLSSFLALVPLTHGYAGFLPADFARGTKPEVFLGLWRLVTDVGIAAAPLLIGAISAVFTLGPAAVVIGGFGLAGAAFHVRYVQETLIRPPRPGVKHRP
jgi:MFS family permease